MKFRPFAALLIVMCCTLMSCKTIEPVNSVLKDMQEWATPEPLQRLTPAHEQSRAKAAMVQWVEEYLKHEYQIVDQRFVLTAQGETNGAAIGSKALQHVTQNLNGTLKINGWYDDDKYRIFLWTFGDRSPRYVAFVWSNDFLPGTHERTLVGYFELASSAQR